MNTGGIGELAASLVHQRFAFAIHSSMELSATTSSRVSADLLSPRVAPSRAVLKVLGDGLVGTTVVRSASRYFRAVPRP